MELRILAVPMLAALVASVGAVATTAAPAAAQYLAPPYAYGAYGAPANALIGTVTYFYQFNMTVQGPNGAVVPVQLHQGTIINPRGSTIVPGMQVTVRGYWSNGQFFANRIRIR